MGRYRATPVSRLKERIGISRYTDHAPLVPLKKQPAIVVIPLLQHIGAPAIPCVTAGEAVKKGACIGKAQGGISSSIHASIDGTVKNISSTAITLAS
jgi:Na+-translocating ferredoxin:NAD+ oxidoreductase RnfC subunit